MPKRRVTGDSPNEPSDPVISALTEILRNFFAVRCDVFKLDRDSPDYWWLMSHALAFEKIFLADGQPAAKGKKTKPKRWTAGENKEFVETVRKKIADGATVGEAIKALNKRFSGNLKSLVTRYYEAEKSEREGQRDRITRAILDQPPPEPPSSIRPRRTKKSAPGTTNS
jgi:hypothetical protein